MNTTDSFGVHFIARQMPSGNTYIYARISVNRTRAELGIKQRISKLDWNDAKGIAKALFELLTVRRCHYLPDVA